MSFKDNLLRKLEIDALARKVSKSIAPADSEQKLDRKTMAKLLAMGGFQTMRERDLDLYLLQGEPPQGKILVLDNELPVYHTTVEDVAMRKSPFIKEMANIRNIIKILKDSDVKISTKAESLQMVRQICVSQLDLSFTRADLQAIADEGIASLENTYDDGIQETLRLMAELLGYQQAPKSIAIRHHVIYGTQIELPGGEVNFGPMVIYSLPRNKLMYLDWAANTNERSQLEQVNRVAAGKEKASVEGPDVFLHLIAKVDQYPGP